MFGNHAPILPLNLRARKPQSAPLHCQLRPESVVPAQMWKRVFAGANGARRRGVPPIMSSAWARVGLSGAESGERGRVVMGQHRAFTARSSPRSDRHGRTTRYPQRSTRRATGSRPALTGARCVLDGCYMEHAGWLCAGWCRLDGLRRPKRSAAPLLRKGARNRRGMQATDLLRALLQQRRAQ
jgi:hypothetical protein